MHQKLEGRNDEAKLCEVDSEPEIIGTEADCAEPVLKYLWMKRFHSPKGRRLIRASRWQTTSSADHASSSAPGMVLGFTAAVLTSVAVWK